MKKILTILMIICMLFSFCACSGSKESSSAAQTGGEIVLSDTVKTYDTAQQLELIYENAAYWTADEDGYESYFYAVTDLDDNGRLELFSASTQGTGIFTTGRLFEVNESFNGLAEYPLTVREGDFIPEVIVYETERYTQPDGTRKYVFIDSVRVDARESHAFTELFTLKNGSVTIDPMAECAYFYTEGDKEVIKYADSEGNGIDAEIYEHIVENSMPEAKVDTAHFGWFMLSDGELPELLRQSSEVFSGALDYMPGQEPKDDAADISSVPVGADGPVRITKNPSGEAVNVGGKTWFIAHADGAETMEWYVLDPEGVGYTLEKAVSMHPGLKLEALEGDTLAVSDIPESFNGWSVKAVFLAGDSAAATEAAPVFVGDFLSAYDSVIQRYKEAYTQGELTPARTAELFISEMAAYSANVGYAFKDINKDGIPELFIAGINSNLEGDPLLYEVCTLADGKPVNLCTSYGRDRYYLRSDSSILNVGSSGAAYTSYYVLRFDSEKLTPSVELCSDLDGEAVAYWHYSENGGSEQRLDYDSGLRKAEQLEAAVYLPFLTKLA